ncbi:MAG: archaellin/type IV pilin N-terminal domain-containing protein [Candidatus Nanohaloarchaea archaeon]|nr:archaellin/type IV pilin N-terminal domain-containing protein [Candidatus Nanohaloarchaea archaeon]
MRVNRADSGRKGVSPLIAAVLLIAFTMAVAAILTAWVTTFTQEQTAELGNKSAKQIDCSFGQLEIFDTTSDTTWVTVAITNTGTVDFNNTSVTTLSGGSVLGKGYLSDLGSGQTKSINVSWSSGGAAETVRIATQQCPTVTDEATVN